ncbi:MAG: hypothetical protein CL910_16570 [Deltaproteobacteria bacterium]|jgi:hypothetical protein|nr:hypothetical protein [Deltaproteobacteria bacterium]
MWRSRHLGYRAYPELVEAIRGLEGEGARLSQAGTSVRGEPIWCVELGPPEAEALSVLLAGQHAMEWIGVEALLVLLERLLTDPPADRRVLAFPLLNPDGYARAARLLRWRIPWLTRANANGVDLNRNWPTYWQRGLLGHLPGLESWSGSGTRPAGEPEVRAVCDRLDAEHAAGQHIDRALSLHSFGRMLLHPYSGSWRAPADRARHREAADRLRARLPRGYRILQASRWFPWLLAYGAELDHLHAAYGATSLLVECSAGGRSLLSPLSWLHPWRWYNPRNREREARAIGTALEPFVRGEG